MKEEDIHILFYEIQSVSREKMLEAIDFWSEGDPTFKQVLLACYENGIETQFSCAGHGKNDGGGIGVIITPENERKVLNMMNVANEMKKVQIIYRTEYIGCDVPGLFINYNTSKHKKEFWMKIAEAAGKEIEKKDADPIVQKIFEFYRLHCKNIVSPENRQKSNEFFSHFRTYEDIGSKELEELLSFYNSCDTNYNPMFYHGCLNYENKGLGRKSIRYEKRTRENHMDDFEDSIEELNNRSKRKCIAFIEKIISQTKMDFMAAKKSILRKRYGAVLENDRAQVIKRSEEEKSIDSSDKDTDENNGRG